jgi:hypothetical protein
VRHYRTSAPAAPTLVLAHGAGAGHDHPWIAHAARGLADRGIHVVTFNFAYIDAGRKVPDPGRVLEETFRGAWDAVDPAAPAVFAGGKSMGGRIASQVAARGGFAPPPAGLLFFGYPLHPPRRPADRRDRHLPAITTPMLFLHGTRDPFGSPDEMIALTRGLDNAALELVEGADHSLVRPKRQDPAGRAMEAALDCAATWVEKVMKGSGVGGV